MPSDEEVVRRLAETSISVDQGSMTLKGLAQLVRDTTGVPVYADWDALAIDGLDPDSSVSLSGGKMSVKQLLENARANAVSGDRELAHPVEFGALVITSRHDASRRSRIELYEIEDLLSLLEEDRRGQRVMAQSIVDLIAEVVAPESWDINGGEIGSMRALESVIVVRTIPEHHEQVVSVLANLRGFLLADTQQRDEKIRLAQRRARLTAIVDARLHRFVESLAAQAEPAEGGGRHEALLVSVLVRDVDGAMRDRLEAVGLDLQAELSEQSFVIGQVAAVQIERLALLDGVRRVELTIPEALSAD